MLGHITSTPREFNLEQTGPAHLDLFAVLVTLATSDPDAWGRVNRSLPFRVLRKSDTQEVALAWWERDPDWRRSGERSTQSGGVLPDWTDRALMLGCNAQELRAHPEAPVLLWPILPSEPRGVAG